MGSTGQNNKGFDDKAKIRVIRAPIGEVGESRIPESEFKPPRPLPRESGRLPGGGDL